MKERIEYYKQHRKYDHADHTVCKVFSHIVLKDLDAHFLIYFSVVILDQKLFDLVRDLQALYDRAFPGFSRETGCLSHLFHLLIKAAGLQSTLLHRFVYSRIMFQPGCRLWNRYTRCKQRDEKGHCGNCYFYKTSVMTVEHHPDEIYRYSHFQPAAG